MPPWPYWVFVLTLVILHFLLHLALGIVVAPDLITVAVLLTARRVNRGFATLVGALLGLLRDGLALAAFGVETVALAVVGYLGGRTRDWFMGDSWLFILFYLFLGKWLHDVIYTVLRGVAMGEGVVDPVGNLLIGAPLAAVYTAIAGGVVLAFYRWLADERRG